jgi:hypothetical protein
MGWRPLSKRGVADDEYDALHDGVPPWLKTTLLDWLAPFFEQTDVHRNVQTDFSRIRELERLLRVDLTGVPNFELHIRLANELSGDEQLLLDAVDLALRWCDAPGVSPQDVAHRIAPVERWLSEAGSAWRVARCDGKPCLERRVDATVTQSGRQVMAKRTAPAST